MASATVRIDTVGMILDEEMATSSLTFVASKKGLIREANADMTVDLSVFDFSMESYPSRLKVLQEETASTTVKVKLMGSACLSPKPVSLLLKSTSMPPNIHYNFSPDSVIPPGEATLSFKASSGLNTGFLKVTLVGCCADEEREKTKRERTAEMTLRVELPPPYYPPGTMDDLESEPGPGEVRIDSLENLMEEEDFSLEEREQARKGIKDETEKGYIEATEEEVEVLKRSKMHLHPMNDVRGLLEFEPVSLKDTPFKRFRLEGGYPEGRIMDDTGTRWVEVVRIFAMPNGSLVELRENDFFISGGGGSYVAREALNENVNGFPAVLSVQQSPSGSGLSSLSWESTTTGYTLRMEGNVRKNGQYGLFLDLARSITERKSKVGSRGDTPLSGKK